jgi:hypothetical protein
MHRTDRLSFRPFSRWFPATLLHLDARSSDAPSPSALSWAALCFTAAALSAGCTLITDVDRSKIPAAEIIPPPATAPVDSSDAGTPPSTASDAGSSTESDAGDAGAGDAGAGDAG